jgi:hypothetical protein
MTLDVEEFVLFHQRLGSDSPKLSASAYTSDAAALSKTNTGSVYLRRLDIKFPEHGEATGVGYRLSGMDDWKELISS